MFIFFIVSLFAICVTVCLLLLTVCAISLWELIKFIVESCKKKKEKPSPIREE